MANIFPIIASVVVTLSFLFVSSASADQNLTKRALVYKGPGACPEMCAESAAEIAKLAGFEPIFVGPEVTDPSIFTGVAVWIQPGGKSSTAAKNMEPALKQNLKDFIARGGGYVGFCAGGFLSTSIIGSTGNIGLGIMPGRSVLLEVEDDAIMVDVSWGALTRHLYWEGGPYFVVEPTDPVEITATYADGKAASVRANYGLGRVYVTGPHPEAPQSWRDAFGLQDTDGLDADLAAEMVVWAASSPSFME